MIFNLKLLQCDKEKNFVGCNTLNQQYEAQSGRNRKGFTIRALEAHDNQMNKQHSPRKIYPYLKGMYDFQLRYRKRCKYNRRNTAGRYGYKSEILSVTEVSPEYQSTHILYFCQQITEDIIPSITRHGA